MLYNFVFFATDSHGCHGFFRMLLLGYFWVSIFVSIIYGKLSGVYIFLNFIFVITLYCTEFRDLTEFCVNYKNI